MSVRALRPPLYRPIVALLALLLVLPVTQLLGASPAFAAPGAATGAVYDALGDPLGGVTVRAYAAPSYSTPGPVATTTAEGDYTLPLPAGTYHLTFVKTGYAPASYGGDEAIDVVVDGDGDISVDGESVEDNVLDDVTLESTQEQPLSGLVKNAGGTPLAGIVVTAHPAGDPEVAADTATTAANGSYSLGLPLGTYQLEYTDAGGTYLPAWYGGAEPGRDITVQGDGQLLVDGAPSGCASLCDVTLTQPVANTEYPIAGGVVDAIGDPIAGVAVAVTPIGASTDSGTGTTDAQGAYSVPVLPGTYRVGFSRTGFTTSTYPGDGAPQATVTVANNGALSVAPTEDLIGNRLGDVTLASVPYLVGGRVVKASAPSEPLVGITVRAFPAGDDTDAVATTTTNTNGLYALDLPIGSYDLQFVDQVADGTDYVVTYLGGSTPAPVTVGQNGTISYGEGSTIPDVAMTVPPADATYDVSGVVSDVNGDGIDGVVVTADAIAPTPAAQGESVTTAVVGDEHGRYTLALEAGSYQVSFDGGADFADATYTGDGDTAATITVAGTGVVSVNGSPVPGGVLDGVELAGTTSYQLTGKVVGSTTGSTGLVGITVTVYREGETTADGVVATATTGSDGRYAVTGLKVGSYVLRFTDNVPAAPSYVVTWLGDGATGSPVKIGQGGVLTFDGATVTNPLPTVTMAVPPPDATFAVTGSVSDVLGEAIGGVTVKAAHTGSTPADQDVTTTTATSGDALGTYTLALEVGTYQLSYTKTGFAGATYDGDGETAATITVEGGGQIRVGTVEAVGGQLDNVELAGLTSYPLTGKVTNGSVGLPGITVKVYAEGDTTPGTEVAAPTTTGSTGAFTTNVKIGSYVLQFSGSSGTVLYSTRWYGAGVAPGTAVQVGQGGAVSADGEALTDVVMTPATVDTTYPLVGSVVDANYEGLAGVTVTAEPVGGGTAPTATSGADGDFQLDLKPGKYKVSYEKAAAGGVAGYAKTYYLDPDGEEGTEVAVIDVALDGTIKIAATVSTDGLGAQVLTNATRHPVTGTVVTETATGLAGITVQAFSEDDPSVAAATTTTGAAGAYALSLLVGTYTLRFTDNVPAAPTYAVTSLGGATPSAVRVATGGQLYVDDVAVAGALSAVTMTAVAADVTYPLAGVVYDENYENGLNDVKVEALPVSGTSAGYAQSTLSATDPDTGDVGGYRVDVRPGKYQLRFSKAGYQTTYLTNYDDTTVPVTVTVLANGVVTAPGLDPNDGGLDVQLLLPAPKLLTAPKLTGRLAVGQKVTTTLGSWSPNVTGAAYRDSTYVEWFLDGKPADDYASGYYSQTFLVPIVAVNKKLTYRLTIEDPNGVRAPAVYSSKAVAVPKAVSTVKGAFKKGKLTVTVTVPGLPKPTGKITLLEGKKKIGKGTVLAKKKGVVVIKLSKLKKGKHKITIVYAGTATVVGSTKVVKIKV